MKKTLIGILTLILVFAAIYACAEEVPDGMRVKIYGGARETDPERAEYMPSEYDVPINKTTFPNKVFRTYVKARFDLDSNGILDLEERLNTDYISITNNYDLTDLTGIEYLPAITSIDISYTAVKKLDLKWNVLLKYVDCHNARLRSLDLMLDPVLDMLVCRDNSLTELDLSGCAKLATLDCGNNPLKSLDVSHNPNLYELNCESCGLTALTLGRNNRLHRLLCQDNALTTIDLKKAPALYELNCRNNPLDGLDLSKNESLGSVDCSHIRLSALDLSHNARVHELMCVGCGLKSLKVSHLGELYWLDCSDNCLTSLVLDESTALLSAKCGGNVLKVTADAGRIPFASLPGFDPERASGWQGCAVEGDGIRVTGSGEVTYEYRAREDRSYPFTLDVTYKEAKITGVTMPVRSFTYTGREITPEVTVKAKVNGETVILTRDEDYTVTCEKNVNRGTAKITVTGINGFTGTVTKKFTITAAKLTKVSVAKASYPYTGKAVKPPVTVKAKLGKKTVTLEEGKDYKAYYKSYVKAGTATVTVKGKGNYTGTLQNTFTIKPVKILTVTLDAAVFDHTGEEIRPPVTVRAKVDGAVVVLKPDKDYTLTYENNVGPGTAAVTVKGIGNYTGTITKQFTIREAAE